MSMTEHPLKLWGAGPRALKVQLVAAFAGVPLEPVPHTQGVTNQTPHFLKNLNALGKVRFLNGSGFDPKHLRS